MKEYRLDNLTIKEHLLELAERGNKSFAESLNPGVEHVLGIRIPDLRKLAERTMQKVGALTKAEYAELVVYAADEV